jgi:hypothetical protein
MVLFWIVAGLCTARTFDGFLPRLLLGEEWAVIRPERIVTCAFPETVIDLWLNGEGDGPKELHV